MIVPMTAHCHTHSCACASMRDSIAARNAVDKSNGSSSSLQSEALSLGHACAFKYENDPAELSGAGVDAQSINSINSMFQHYLI
jgi:hypothetical protein